jgi:plasmid stabilization system protein ParE
MPHAVRITRRALAEIDQALGWLSERSPEAAARWHRRLLADIDSLQDHPERCPLAPEDEWYEGGELLQLLSGRRTGVYRILFEVRGRTVFILRVRHSARDLLRPDEL